VNVEQHRSAIVTANAAIVGAGENLAREVADAREERERVATLVARGAAAPKELKRLDDELAEKVATYRGQIEHEYAKAGSAFDAVAREVADERASRARRSAVSDAWQDRVKPAVDQGLGIGQLLDLFRGDETALEALSVNWPSAVALKFGGKLEGRRAKEAVNEAMYEIEKALDVHRSALDRDQWAAVRQVEGLALEIDAQRQLALLHAATGKPSIAERMRLGILIGDGERHANGEYVGG